MKLSNITIAVLLATPFVAQGEDYQVQLGAGYQNQDYGTLERKEIASNGDFHFKPVKTARGPLSEAAFVTRSSHVGVAVSSGSYDNTTTLDKDQGLGADLDYQIDNSKFGVQVGYNTLDVDMKQNAGSVESDNMLVGGSYYLKDEIRLNVSLARSKTDATGTPTADTNTTTVGVKGLASVEGAKYVGWEVSLADGKRKVNSLKEDSRAVGVGGSFYFDRTFSLGGGLRMIDSDDVTEDGQSLSLSASKFFTPKVNLALTYTTFSPSQSTLQDEDFANLAFGYRF